MSPGLVLVGTGFLFGLLFGSFLNVVIHRVPLGANIVPRSACPSCKAPIPWYRNLPLFSWLALRGKCRDCGIAISVRYPLVELAGGLILGFALWRWGPGWSAASSTLFGYTMLVLALIDIDHRILPNIITLPGTLLGLALSFADPRRVPLESILGALLGGGVLYAVAYLYLKMRGREGMGMGDIKMMLLIGAFLGWKGALTTIFIGSLAGSLIGVLVIKLSRRGWEYALPFGTFLAMGAVIVDAYGPEILRWYVATFAPVV